MACTFLGSTLYPSVVRFPLKNSRPLDFKTNLSQLKVMLFPLSVSSRVMMILSWGTLTFPSTSTSSAMLWTFGMLLSILSSLSWKKSSATLSPNSSHSCLKFPMGWLNVVIRLHSLSSMTCQYPDLASRRVKSVKAGRSGGMSSIALLYHWFCLMFLLRFLRFNHNLRQPSLFCSVGWLQADCYFPW